MTDPRNPQPVTGASDEQRQALGDARADLIDRLHGVPAPESAPDFDEAKRILAHHSERPGHAISPRHVVELARFYEDAMDAIDGLRSRLHFQNNDLSAAEAQLTELRARVATLEQENAKLRAFQEGSQLIVCGGEPTVDAMRELGAFAGWLKTKSELKAELAALRSQVSSLQSQLESAQTFGNRWMKAALYATPVTTDAFDPMSPEAFAESRRHAVDLLASRAEKAEAALESAQQREERLREALLRHGHHDDGSQGEKPCYSIEGGPDTCDCGFDAALRSPAQDNTEGGTPG